MIAKKAPGRTGGAGSFKDIGEYITAEKVVDRATGEEVEKAIHVEPVNVLSKETAIAEMDAAALQNPRCQDPVYHCIASWPEGERPTPEQAMDAGKTIMEKLGYAEHQAVIAYHDNTENAHIHIAINRVHPETGKVHAPYNDYETLHRACREIELEQGWSHGRGAFEIDGNGEIKQRDGYEDRELGMKTEARDMEAFSGEQSFKTWLKEEPAKDLKETLEKGGNWQDVHRTLAKHNLEIQEKGSGMVIVDRNDPDKFHAKASDLGRFATAKNLEAKLGEYERPAVVTQLEKPERDYKRDPEKRIDRRQERAEERGKFYEQYKAYKQEHYQTRGSQLKTVTADRKTDLEKIKEQSRADREAIKRQNIPAREKQVLYTAVRLRTAQQKEALDRKAEQKRQTIREQYPDKALGLKEYAQREAQKGNEVAVSVLRGITYREGRETKIEHDRPSTLHPEGKEGQTVLKSLSDLEFKVSRHGNISYCLKESGKEVFRDTGKQILFNDSKDRGSIEAGLRISREKFGNNIQLTGNDDFKKSACQVAHKLGIKITNPEMQPYMKTLEQSRDKGPTMNIGKNRPSPGESIGKMNSFTPKGRGGLDR